MNTQIDIQKALNSADYVLQQKRAKEAEDLKEVAKFFGPTICSELRQAIQNGLEHNVSAIRADTYCMETKFYITTTHIDYKHAKAISKRFPSIGFCARALVINNILPEYKDSITVTRISITGLDEMCETLDWWDYIIFCASGFGIGIAAVEKWMHWQKKRKGNLPLTIYMEFTRKPRHEICKSNEDI